MLLFRISEINDTLVRGHNSYRTTRYSDALSIAVSLLKHFPNSCNTFSVHSTSFGNRFSLGDLLYMKIFYSINHSLSLRNHLFFPVSVLCSQMFTKKLNLRPRIDLTYPVSIVKSDIVKKKKKIRKFEHITKTYMYLYNFDPIKPHFYIVKLVFTGVYIIFSYFCSKT